LALVAGAAMATCKLRAVLEPPVWVIMVEQDLPEHPLRQAVVAVAVLLVLVLMVRLIMVAREGLELPTLSPVQV
jgi:hypothetical protein